MTSILKYFLFKKINIEGVVKYQVRQSIIADRKKKFTLQKMMNYLLHLNRRSVTELSK